MTRVVVAGLGESGVMAAIQLRRRVPDVEVVAIGPSPGLVSGQELGWRLARPDTWARDHRIGYDRFRGLDGVRRIHGRVVGVAGADGSERAAGAGDVVAVRVVDAAGGLQLVPFDVLVIATGVAAGFWRRDDVRTDADVDAEIARHHGHLAGAARIAVVGGGPSAVGSAAHLAERFATARVDLYFPGQRALPHHHPRVWDRVAARLSAAGVTLHPGHRAVLPPDHGSGPGAGPVRWSTGQPDTPADVVLWAVGTARPHTGWLPAELLDADGYVRVHPTLQLPGLPHVFAVGDVAATDPLRTSARNWGGRLVAANVAAYLDGRPLRPYRAPRRRWGSVLGPLEDGLLLFLPDGRAVRVPRWAYERVLQPVAVRRGIWGGVRRR